MTLLDDCARGCIGEGMWGRRCTRRFVQVRALRLGVVGWWERLRGEESGRRTTGTDTRIAVLSLLRHLSLLARIRWRQSWRVRLVIGTLGSSLPLLWVHWLLLVALRRRRILARLLLLTLLRWVLLVAVVGWQWLTVCSIQLSVGRRILATPHSMCRDECLGLGADWSEHAFLRKAHTVCASTIFRLFESRAANLMIKLAACERGK